MPGAADKSLRIGLIGHGDVTDPSFWSGTPAGLFGGLREAGVTPVALNSRPPGGARIAGRLRRPWTFETTNPGMVALSSARATAAVIAARPLDGLIQIGSGYRVRGGPPLATLDDLTVAQGAELSWSDVSTLPRSEAQRWARRQGRIYDDAVACCVGSHWTETSVRDQYGVDPAKIHIVGFGRNFVPAEVPERDWSVPRFLFVGVQWGRKRGPEALAAFAAVREAHPEATFDVVGDHPPLDPQPGVTAYGRLHLSSEADRATLHGLFARATCLVLPSAFEAFGIAYLDAGAAGVPSIGTTVGGAPDAIGPGGVLVDPEDEPGLRAAMLKLCDPETARSLGAAARKHSDLFTWRKVAERMLRALLPERAEAASWTGFIHRQRTESGNPESLATTDAGTGD